MALPRRTRSEWMLAIVFLLVPLASAQTQDPNRLDREGEDENAPVFSLQITPRMLANGLDKLVEKRLAKDYNFDDYQKEEMRRVLHERLPRFLKEHQAELETIWVEWVEGISGDEPPDPAYVAEWAGRLMPLVEKATELRDEVADDMRGFLDDEQQVLLDGYLAAWDVGTRHLTNQLTEFKEGGFDAKRHWPGYKEVRHRDPVEVAKLRHSAERAREVAMAESAEAHGAIPPTSPRGSAAGGAPAAPSATMTPDGKALAADPKVQKAENAKQPPPDDWDRYVEDFIRRYQLNDEQQQKARNLLEQQKSRRDSYLAKKGDDIEALTRMYEGARGDQKRIDVAEAKRAALYEPVSRMFEQLKDRLEKLPTRAQRKAAAERDSAAPAQGESAADRGATKRGK